MDIALTLLAYVLAIVGIAGCIIPVIPGVVLSYAALLCAYFTSYATISTASLWIWLAATIAVTAADFYLPAWMTRRFGGSRAGAIGATVGVFAGFFLFAPAGIVLGPFFGAVLGELLHDRNDAGKALTVGFGSFLAFAVGTGAKLVVCICILIRIATDSFGAASDWLSTVF